MIKTRKIENYKESLKAQFINYFSKFTIFTLLWQSLNRTKIKEIEMEDSINLK